MIRRHLSPTRPLVAVSLAALAFVLFVGCETTAVRVNADDPPGVGQAPPVRHSLTRPHELPEALEIPIASRGEHLFVRTGVDGYDAGHFLLDTGAAMDAVDLGVAGRLQLPEAGDGVALGIAGLEAFTFRRVDQLSVGPLALPARRLAGLNLHRVARHMRHPVNGIVGFSSLKRTPFTLDYQANTLTVYQPQAFTPPTDAASQPLRIARGLPLIAARLADGPIVWLIIDTGADNELTLPRELANRFPKVVAVNISAAGSATGVGGKVTKHRTWIKRIDLMGVSLHNVPVAFEELPDVRQGDSVGRIGHKLLQHFRLTFDPGRKTLYAQWRPDAGEDGDLTGMARHP